MNIKEDYVSFETARLLKEKGFDEECNKVIHQDTKNEYYFGNYTDDIKGRLLLVPTHQMAMKWLREVHKLHIAILWDCGAYIGKNSFCYHIDRMDNYEDKGYNKIGFDSYEQACEVAIKYCLENLI